MHRRSHYGMFQFALSLAALRTFILYVVAISDSWESKTDAERRAMDDPIVDHFVCFNTILEIVCDADRVIVFDSARYGRNHSFVAERCDVPYTRNCDIDVHFSLNRACAGKPRCSMAVNTAFFGDPCGYDEFLRVTYRCIPASAILDDCAAASQHSVAGGGANTNARPPATNSAAAATAAAGATANDPEAGTSSSSSEQTGSGTVTSSGPPIVYDRGYLASPNYPGKYYLDSDCRWRLVVQRQQTIRITLYDFELDVKRAGRCQEFLEISGIPSAHQRHGTGSDVIGSGRVYFRDCGSLGKQMITVDSNEAQVRFKTGQASLAQRGFLLYFEGVGPGCGDLKAPSNGRIQYHITDDVLYANVTCQIGYHLDDALSPLSFQHLRCVGTTWNDDVIAKCSADKSLSELERPSIVVTTKAKPATPVNHLINKTASLVGIALSIASAILLVILLLTLVLYFSRRRHVFSAERRHIFNNLHLESNCGQTPINLSTGNSLASNGSDAILKCVLNKRSVQFPVSTTAFRCTSSIVSQTAPLTARLPQHITDNGSWAGYDVNLSGGTATMARCMNNYRTLPLVRRLASDSDQPEQSRLVFENFRPDALMASTGLNSSQLQLKPTHCCSFGTPPDNYGVPGHTNINVANSTVTTSVSENNRAGPEVLSSFKATGNTKRPMSVGLRLLGNGWTGRQTLPVGWRQNNTSENDENLVNDSSANITNTEDGCGRSSLRLLLDRAGSDGSLTSAEVDQSNCCRTSTAVNTIPDLTQLVTQCQQSPDSPPSGTIFEVAHDRNESSKDFRLPVANSTGVSMREYIGSIGPSRFASVSNAAPEMTSSTDYLVPLSSKKLTLLPYSGGSSATGSQAMAEDQDFTSSSIRS